MDMAFDYAAAAKARKIPKAALKNLESEAAREFPDDPMLAELHVLRAIRTCAATEPRSAVFE